MDREPEELRSLGFFSIWWDACKLVVSYRRLFTKITLVLIFPLAIISLAHTHISDLLFAKIVRNSAALGDAPAGSPSKSRLLSRVTSDWVAAVLFKAAYLVGVLVFSLLSTSAVVYTVASIYTAKDVSFRRVISVVPKVWKRLMVTFVWAFLLLAAYNIVAALLLTIVLLKSGMVALVMLMVAYVAGLACIGGVWSVASVVSVLEDACGMAAMRKSRSLVRGKMWVAIAIFLMLDLVFIGIDVQYRELVVWGPWWWGTRVGWALLMVSLLSLVTLLGLVVQTVVYFVCKSYHHESVDKSSLAVHLELYAGEFVPLNSKGVQMERCGV